MADVEFEKLTVDELKKYLHARGVTTSDYRKADLVRLSKDAFKLNLPVIQTPDDFVAKSTERRTVTAGGRKVVIPYPTDDEWSNDLRQMPPVDLPDIFLYLMRTCGWDNERLKRYRDDDGCKLFKDSHVDNVRINKVSCIPSYVFMKCTCVPETRQNDREYSVWVLQETVGPVVSAECTCVAGDGSCKHVVALLLALNDFHQRHMDRHSETCTDTAQKWDKPRKQPRPSSVLDINTERQKRKAIPSAPKYAPCSLDIDSEDVRSKVFKMCKENLPSALFLHTLAGDNPDAPTLLPSLTEMFQSFDGIAVDGFISHMKETMTEESVAEIEEITRPQHKSEVWHSQRQGRITTSLFHEAIHHDHGQSLIDTILGKTSRDIDAPALKYGRVHEPVAKQLYIERFKSKCKCHRVSDSGLFIHRVKPYLAGTPDGLVECTKCGMGRLEIKCTYKYKDCTIKEISQSKYHFACVNGDAVLSRSSPWYCQIQGQLAVTGRSWCDFVFYTRKSGIHIERIVFDRTFYLEMELKLDHFWKTKIFPLLTK